MSGCCWTIGPRAVLMITASGFIWAISRAQSGRVFRGQSAIHHQVIRLSQHVFQLVSSTSSC